METQASAKNVRISSEKVNLLVAQIKKMPPTYAVQILKFVNKSASPVLSKLIKSAIANAKHNQGAQEQDLIFKEIVVTSGPSYKRFQPISRGRVHHILKRTSHIKVILQSKQVSKVSKATGSTLVEEKKVEVMKGAGNGTKS